MIVLLITSLLLGLLTTVSLLISYYVSVMMNQSTSNNEPSVNQSIMTQTTILIQNVNNAVSDLTSLVTSKVFAFAANIQANAKLYLNIFIFFSLFSAYISNKESFLSQIDKFWRCGIHPLFRNVLFVILQLLRLVWGAVAPIYNYELLLFNQLFTSTKVMYFKCNFAAIFDSLKILLNIVMGGFKSIAVWSGAASGEMSVNNNLVTNELDLLQTVMNVQRLVLKQSEVTGCICEGFNDVFEFIYIAFRQDELAISVNHFINIPLALVQIFIQMLPPWKKFPEFTTPMNHALGFVYFGGRWIDQVLLKWVIHIISLFDDSFKMQGVPEEFFVTILARWIMALIHALWTFLRIVKTLAMPIGPALTSSNYLMEVFNANKVLEQVNLAIVGTSDLTAWFLKIQDQLTSGIPSVITSGDVIFSMPVHTHIVCNLETATAWTEQQACAARLIAQLPFDVLYLLYTLVVEVLVKVLMFQEESLIQTLQRYDGVSFPRNIELSCEYRANITYDLTVGKCKCDYGFGKFRKMVPTAEHPFGDIYYDPYCGQPNLQANYFSKVERIEAYATTGWYEKLAEIWNINTLVVNEFWRTVIKVALQMESIISGDFFSMKTNCGYGLSSKLLRQWFDDRNSMKTLAEQIKENQDDNCKGGTMYFYSTTEQKAKCILIDTAIKNMMCMETANPSGRAIQGGGTVATVPRCKNVNRAGCECNWALANFCTGHKTNGKEDSIDIFSEQECTDIYSGGIWNENTLTCTGQTINQIGVNSTTKKDCEKTTTAGLWTGPISYDNKCKCIRAFPDDIMEFAQGPYRNLVLRRMHTDDVAVHWCNTFWAEWGLHYADQYAGIVEKAISVFHPSYEDAKDGSNPFCEERTYTLYETTILKYPLWRFKQNKDIYDLLRVEYDSTACDVYGTTDFICSIGMSWRNAVRTAINEARVLIIAMSRLLEGDAGGIQISFSERLCDIARTVSAISSILPSLLGNTAVEMDFMKGVSQFIFANGYVLLAFLDTINHILLFLEDLLKGQLDFSAGPAAPFFQLIFGIINVWIDMIRLLLQAEGNMLNGIATGAGEFIFDIDNIIEIIQKYFINEATFEIIGLVSKIGIAIVQFFVSGSTQITGFFDDLFTLIKKFWNILLTQLSKLTSLLLEALGPTFDDIRGFIQSICGTIEDVICFITLGEECDMGCDRRHNRRHLFSSGNHTSRFQDAVWHVADKMEWNGTSSCDLFIHSYKGYKFDDLRPAEQIQLHECVDQRMMIIELNKRLNLTLPEDLIYNWKRKWIMGKMGMEGALIVFNHKMGKITTKEMIHQLKQKGIHYNDILPYYNRLSTNVKDTFSLTNFDYTIESILKPETVEQEKSSLGHIYRLYNIGKRASKEIYHHSVKKNTVHKIKRGLNFIYQHQYPKNGFAMPSIPTHLKHAYHTWTQLKTTPPSLSKKNARRFILRAAGVVTDTTPCEQQKDNYVCINCAILDNLLNVAIRDGLRMSEFYQNVYAPVTVPSFVRFWTNNTESQAWSEDMGKMIGGAMKKVGNDIDDLAGKIKDTEISLPPAGEINIDIYLETPGYDPYFEEYGASTRLESKRKLYSNKTYTNTTLSNYLRAKNDWLWFFRTGWNPFVDHTGPDARPSVTNVLANFLSQPEDTYVPYFAYSLLHYIIKPFDMCPMEKMYCSYNTFEDRQRLIVDAFFYMFLFTLIIIGIQYQFGFPIATLLVGIILLIYFGIYMYTVYQYTLYCFPSVPNCWADDLFAFVHDKLMPSCFCYYLPGLSETCNPDTCFLCSRVTEFSTCMDRIPLYKSMGIAWSTLFFFRKNYPSILLFLYKTIPFAWMVRSYEPLVEMTQMIMEGIEIEQVELDCLNISYMDMVMIGIVLYFVLTLMSIVAPTIVRIMQHVTNIVTIYITIIYSMALSLEIQTTALKD